MEKYPLAGAGRVGSAQLQNFWALTLKFFGLDQKNFFVRGGHPSLSVP
jgi:hypothetical protein